MGCRASCTPQAGGFDLHLHTWCSDGVDDPWELAAAVRRAGLALWAITDHDTLDGWRAASSDRRTPSGLIPGVEVTCQEGVREIHVLGLGVDPGHAGLEALLARIRGRRHERLAAIIDRLPAPVREGLTVAGVVGRQSVSPSRSHLAMALARRGAAPTPRLAFAQWLGDEYLADGGLPAFMPIPEAAAAIRAAGGVALLAHPGAYGDWDLVGSLLPQFDGVEAGHPRHAPEDVARIRSMASARGILVSGGSDLHRLGTRLPGDRRLTEADIAPLRERLGVRPLREPPRS